MDRSLDEWRNYFSTANGDIFEIIDQAIRVAALDYPTELKSVRERIAEKLYTFHLNRCLGTCERVELLGDKFQSEGEGDAGEDSNGKTDKLTAGIEFGVQEAGVMKVSQECTRDAIGCDYEECTRVAIGCEDALTTVGRPPLTQNIRQNNKSTTKMNMLANENKTRGKTDKLTAGIEFGVQEAGVIKVSRECSRVAIGCEDALTTVGRPPLTQDTRQNNKSTTKMNMLANENKSRHVTGKEAIVNVNTLSHATPNRPLQPNTRQKVNNEVNIKHNTQQDNELKLEATKRKLHETYQRIEDAKKRRTIQVLESHELPKQRTGPRKPFTRPKWR